MSSGEWLPLSEFPFQWFESMDRRLSIANNRRQEKLHTLIMPGKSTRTILGKPGPFTVITSVLTVLPCLTLFNIRSRTYKTGKKFRLKWYYYLKAVYFFAQIGQIWLFTEVKFTRRILKMRNMIRPFTNSHLDRSSRHHFLRTSINFSLWTGKTRSVLK